MAFPKGGGSDLDTVAGLGQAQGTQDGGGLVNGCASPNQQIDSDHA